MIVSGAQLRDWLREAKAGDVLAYARATFLIPNDVTRRLYDLAQSGHVALTRVRRDNGMGDENFLYMARRTALPMEQGKAAGGSRGQVRHVGGRAPQDRRVGDAARAAMAVVAPIRAQLAEYRAAGRSLPSAPALARAWGLPSAYAARIALRAAGMDASAERIAA